MLFSVPQFIDVEDKIAGPLTAKQLLWMIGAGAVMFVLYTMLSKGLFIVLAVPVGIFFSLSAFYKPQGQSFIVFVINFFFFLFRPKLYVWKRISQKKSAKVAAKKQAPPKNKKRPMTSEELAQLARVLDSEGQERSKKIMEIVGKRQQATANREKFFSLKKKKPEAQEEKKKIHITKRISPESPKEGKTEGSKNRVSLKKEDSSQGRIIYMR